MQAVALNHLKYVNKSLIKEKMTDDLKGKVHPKTNSAHCSCRFVILKDNFVLRLRTVRSPLSPIYYRIIQFTIEAKNTQVILQNK